MEEGSECEMEEDGDENADGKEEGEDDEEEEENGSDVRAYLPGVDKMEEGEELEVDQSAYEMLHSVNMEWPALSFDIIPDALGDNRTTVWMLSSRLESMEIIPKA